MSKIQQEIALRDKYKTDDDMSYLMVCEYDIKCINYGPKTLWIIRSYARRDWINTATK